MDEKMQSSARWARRVISLLDIFRLSIPLLIHCCYLKLIKKEDDCTFFFLFLLENG